MERELILLVKNNPALFAKTTKEYCGIGYNKDLAWQRIGSSLTKRLSGPEASKLFYNIRQRFGRERRKVLFSLKGKSGQGAVAPYVSPWPLYEDCMFLADHIVARKTSSSYSSALPKTQQAAAVKSNFEIGGVSPIFARPSPSPSPPVFRSTPSPQTSGLLSPSSVWSSDNELFHGDAEFDTSDSRSSVGQSPAATAEGASSSSGVSSASILKIIKKDTKSKGKRTVPQPDNFAVKKKKDDDVLTQAILNQTTTLSSIAAKLGESL
ncbi:tuftelin-interacting protein 11, partial [Lasius niger]